MGPLHATEAVFYPTFLVPLADFFRRGPCKCNYLLIGNRLCAVFFKSAAAVFTKYVVVHQTVIYKYLYDNQIWPCHWVILRIKLKLYDTNLTGGFFSLQRKITFSRRGEREPPCRRFFKTLPPLFGKKAPPYARGGKNKFDASMKVAKAARPLRNLPRGGGIEDS